MTARQRLQSAATRASVLGAARRAGCGKIPLLPTLGVVIASAALWFCHQRMAFLDMLAISTQRRLSPPPFRCSGSACLPPFAHRFERRLRIAKQITDGRAIARVTVPSLRVQVPRLPAVGPRHLARRSQRRKVRADPCHPSRRQTLLMTSIRQLLR